MLIATHNHEFDEQLLRTVIFLPVMAEIQTVKYHRDGGFIKKENCSNL